MVDVEYRYVKQSKRRAALTIPLLNRKQTREISLLCPQLTWNAIRLRNAIHALLYRLVTISYGVSLSLFLSR